VGRQTTSRITAPIKGRRIIDGGDETTDALEVNGSRDEETTEAAGTQHPFCVGLERPGTKFIEDQIQ
jgi:hypothetical protein